MPTKLTISLEKQVIEKAKAYAKENGRSLSNLIESYLKGLTSKNQEDDLEITPLVKSMQGTLKAPSDIDYKAILGEERLKRDG